eukprot:5136787-Amphidinium_carterae.2
MVKPAGCEFQSLCGTIPELHLVLFERNMSETICMEVEHAMFLACKMVPAHMVVDTARKLMDVPIVARLKRSPLTVDLCSFSMAEMAQASKERKERSVSVSRSSSDPSSGHDARVERAAFQAGARPKPPPTLSQHATCTTEWQAHLRVRIRLKNHNVWGWASQI